MIGFGLFTINVMLFLVVYELSMIFKYLRYLTYIGFNSSVTTDRKMSFREFVSFMKKK